MTFPQLPEEPPGRDGDSGGGRDGERRAVEVYAPTIDAPAQDLPRLEKWLTYVAARHGRRLHTLTYVLLSDEELHAMNVEHLGHDTLTDIITFDLRDEPGRGPIEGECYVSLERVRDNAAGFGESPARELRRVMAHGLLHLCGLGDKTEPEAARMRAAEEEALRTYPG